MYSSYRHCSVGSRGVFAFRHSLCLAWPGLRPKPLMVSAESSSTASTLSSIALMRSDTFWTAWSGSDIATSQVSGAGASPLSGSGVVRRTTHPLWSRDALSVIWWFDRATREYQHHTQVVTQPRARAGRWLRGS